MIKLNNIMKKILNTLIYSEYFLELRRKTTHIVFGVTVLMAYFGYWYANIKHVFIVRFIFVLFYILLTNTSTINSLLFSISQFSKKLFERKSTSVHGIGGLMLLFGCYLPILAGCNQETVMVIIITLSIGDGFATIIGKYLGIHALYISKSRSLLGTLGGLIAALGVSILLIKDFDMRLGISCIIGITIELFLGLISNKISKVVARYSLDNILIPTGMMIFLLFME